MSIECTQATERITRDTLIEQAASALRKASEILDESAPHLEANVRAGLLVSIASEWRLLQAQL